MINQNLATIMPVRTAMARADFSADFKADARVRKVETVAAGESGAGSRVGRRGFFDFGTTKYHFVPRLKNLAETRNPRFLWHLRLANLARHTMARLR